MKKKKSSPSKKKTNGLMAGIAQLQTCIAKDQAALEKAFQKAVVDSGKKMASATKSLDKAKKSLAQATKTKKKSPEKHGAATSLLKDLTADLTALKTEQANIKAEQKKFLLQKKALKQIDNALMKSVKKSSKTTSKAAGVSKKQKKLKNAEVVNMMVDGLGDATETSSANS